MDTRIAGYDFARCLALFGLVVANFRGNVEHVGLDLLYDSIHGGVIATFFVLGGVGASLLKQRNQRTNDAHIPGDSRKRLIKRAASLLVIGICCNLIWQTHFLCFYSICIAIGALLLTVSNRWLWSLVLIFVFIWAAFPFWMFDYYDVIENFEILQDSDPWTGEGTVFRLYLYRFHSIFFWSAFLLIGMWLGRQEVHYLRVRKDVVFSGIAAALVSACAPWLVINYVPWLISGYRPSVSDLFSKAISMLFTPVYYLGICGAATAIIGSGLILAEKYPSAKWTRAFLATGQLALTLYVVHLIIGEGLLKTLGVLDKTLPLGVGSGVIFCICAVIFSHLWRKRFERGPLEWGMRRVTG